MSQINGVPVLRVWRRGEAAVHVTDTPFEVGLQVEQEVDWGRRFDHMQQHSGEFGGHHSSESECRNCTLLHNRTTLDYCNC